MLDIMYKAPSMKDVKECIITEEVIERKAEPEYVFKAPARKRA